MVYEPWMDHVRVGDVLVRGRDNYRVVRNVSHHKDGRLRCVTFSIKHCSWTGRCYTVVNYNDLNYAGYRPTGRRVRLRTKLDKRIALNITRSVKDLGCCDVRGVS